MINQLTISIFNATGLPRPAIDSLLAFTSSSNLIFVTETWLLPPYRYPTSWIQHHVYGVQVNSNTRQGSQGISLFVNTSYPFPVHCLPDTSSDSPFHLSCIVASTLIHCVYLPTSLPDEEALSILHSLPLSHPHATMTIFCGDFNARLGSLVGDHRQNARGTMLLLWMQTYGLTLWNAELAHGQPTFLTHNGTSIIDLFFSTNHPANSSLSIREDLSLDSDHKLVHFSFTLDSSLPPSALPSSNPRRLWNFKKLRDPENCKRYCEHFRSASQPFINNLKQLTTLPAPPSTARQSQMDHFADTVNNSHL